MLWTINIASEDLFRGASYKKVAQGASWEGTQLPSLSYVSETNEHI